MALVDNPAGTILAWEHFDTIIACIIHPTSNTGRTHWDSGHTGGLNILFCDGHVKRYERTQLRTEMFTWWQEPTE